MRSKRRQIKKQNIFYLIFPILTILGTGILFAYSSFFENKWTYNWSGIRQNIKESVIMTENQGLRNGIVGLNYQNPYDTNSNRINWIKNNATEAELLKLIEYPNGIIKALAYEGLIRNENFENKTELILRAINDKEYDIMFFSGCMSSSITIGEYIINYVLSINDNQPLLIGYNYSTIELSKEDRIKILYAYRKNSRSF